MKILVCSDGSIPSQRAMERAVSIIGERKDIEVAIIHVFEKKTLYKGVNVDYMRMTKGEYDGVIKSSKIAGKKVLDEAVLFFKEKNIQVTTILKGGHPARAITITAREEKCDMIIIGRRGMSGLNRMFLGSVSNAVLHDAKTDVLVVR